MNMLNDFISANSLKRYFITIDIGGINVMKAKLE